MNQKNKKIGIWGFGIVGKTALAYFARSTIITSVMDAKQPTSEEQLLIDQAKSIFVDQTNIDIFLQEHDYILASPGIDIRPYQSFQHKFITELDIFSQAFKKPTIAITGTIGKTSITHLLSEILGTQKKIALGGNIGKGMLSLIDQQKDVDYALLELSSFQLEHCSVVAPDLAILTNFFPNHLDRHGSLDSYFKAKCKLFAYQTKHQKALVPLDIVEKITHAVQPCSPQFHFFSDKAPTKEQQRQFPHAYFFYLDNNIIMQEYGTEKISLISLEQLPTITFDQNWLIIVAAVRLLGMPLSMLHRLPSLTLPAHRIEKVATVNNIDFYNDSKGTIIEATLAAVKKLQGKPILLFMGGISKGVDRSTIFAALKNLVSTIFCFGSEAYLLQKYAQTHNIPCFAFQTLEEAFAQAIKIAKQGDQILFSPSGASYDLFAHYQERGDCFKKLVEQYKEQH